MKKEVTLITGGTLGIGYELAKLFAYKGYDLLLVARDEKKLESVKAELEKYNITVYIISKDLTKEQAMNEILHFVEENNLVVDNLVNNAGFGSFGYFHEVDIEKDLDMIKVNIYALTALTKLFLPSMVDRGKGGVLNVASTAAFQGGPMMSVYYATKAYVLSITEALSKEVKDKGVRITALCPGPTSTDFQKRAEVKKSEIAKGYMMDAATVAKIGFHGFMKGKTIVIPGLKNKLLIQCNRLLPRTIVTSVIKKVNKGK